MGHLATHETHISQVFFTADRAYKLLKPVTLSFVDHADRDARLAAARKELELNRRLAPDVYLGLGDLREGDELVDHVIVMRRMPAETRLSDLAGRPEFDDCVRGVARAVAAFHAAQPMLTDSRVATADAVGKLWADNFAVIEANVPDLIDRDEHARVRELAETYVGTNAELFDRRIADGFVRDGHGDLLAEDIFCLPDGPRILDCLAFRDDLRIGDVLSDIGFLAMDLHRVAGPEVARKLLRWYQEFTYEHHPASLAHHYVGYRAHVRAKVACLKHGDGQPGQAELAVRHHDLARHHLERAQIRLVLIGGAPAVGKTAVAGALSPHFGFNCLSSDEIRKDLAGVPHDEHPPAQLDGGLYEADMTDLTYEEMLREAELLLAAGENVILDASWTLDRHRRLARELATRRGAAMIEIECSIDQAVARERAERRSASGVGPSDAGGEVADALRARRDPWPEAANLSTAGPLDVTIGRACDLLEACLDG